MKKRLAAVILLGFFLLMMGTGCGKKEETEQEKIHRLIQEHIVIDEHGNPRYMDKK